jgi:colicin import membrane protein
MVDRDRSRTPATQLVEPRSTEKKTEQSSVLFSLNELMQLEGQRIEEESSREREAREREHAAKMEAELRLRVADEARRKADAERRHAEELSLREEEARLAAMREATLERARIETLDRARLAELELVHKHEQVLRRDEADRTSSRMRAALVAVVTGALLIGGAGIGYYFGVVQPKDEATRRELAEKAATAEAVARDRRAEVDALARREAGLERELDGIRSQNSALPVVPTLTANASAPPVIRPTATVTVVIPPPQPRVCSARERLDPASTCIDGM